MIESYWDTYSAAYDIIAKISYNNKLHIDVESIYVVCIIIVL